MKDGLLIGILVICLCLGLFSAVRYSIKKSFSAKKESTRPPTTESENIRAQQRKFSQETNENFKRMQEDQEQRIKDLRYLNR